MKRYPGTVPFTSKHKDLFFGRKKEMAELNQLIGLEQLVVLYGKSGLGKSSLIQAGIIPTIEAKKNYEPIYIRLTAFRESEAEDDTINPTQITKDNIQGKVDKPTFLEQLRPDENSLWSVAKNRQINGGNHRLILFFDQFEELFQYSERAINAFVRELRELLNTAIPQRIRDEINKQDDDFLTEEQEDILYEPLEIKAVFGIRSDRMHLMNKLARSLPQILANNYELQPLALDDAKDAIVKPAQKEGTYNTPIFNYTESALDKILNFLKDSETNRVEAFQLQLLCQTFEQKVEQKGIKTIDDTEVVDLEYVIDTYFQNSIHSFLETEQRLIQQLIAKELVSPDGNVRYSIFEQKLKTEYFISNDLLDKLIDLRLLRRERTNRGVIYEISHDTFLKSARQIKSDLEDQEQEEALAKAEAEAKEAKERAALQRSLYEKAEAQRKIADEKTAIAKKSEAKARRNLVTAIFVAVIALGIAFFAYLAQKEAERAKEQIIVNQAVSKAKELQNFAKSYKIYGKNDYACQSYEKAFITLDTIPAAKKLEFYQEIKKLKEQCD